MPPTDLHDLPEAIPLRRVSPVWRVLAVLALLGFAGLGMLVCVLLVALYHQGTRATAFTAATVPPRAVFMGTTAPLFDDDPINPNNLPYPTQEDLCPTFAVSPAPESPRQRFLALGQDVWKSPRGVSPDVVSVSPDGTSLAFPMGPNLAAGSFGGIVQIMDGRQGQVVMPPIPGRPGPPVVAYNQVGTVVSDNPTPVALVGVPAWSSDGQHVYVARGNGTMRRYEIGASSFEDLLFHGDTPAAWPDEAYKAAFVRSQPRTKVDLPGQRPAPDPTEVIVVDFNTGNSRLLVRASPSSWSHLSPSPDGKRLALVSDRGHEGEQPRRWRVFVLDIESGKLTALTPPAATVGPVCWAPDGDALVYARSQEPLPLDAWDSEPERRQQALDLFVWDLTTNQETRVSRGGGFWSPSVSADGTLFYLTWPEDAAGRGVRLRRVPLVAVRALAEKTPDVKTPDAAAWTDLIDKVLAEAGVGGDADGTQLTPGVLAKLADTYQRHYRERFQAEPPGSPQQFDHQRQALRALGFPPQARDRLRVLLGAVEGEYLRQQHGATWNLTRGPLVRPAAAAPEDDSALGYVLNPFQLADVPAMSLTTALRQADGRSLVLANDPAAGQAAVAALAVPELDQAAALFKDGKVDEAEALLVKLLGDEQHRRNVRLTLQAGKLLYEHGCKEVLRKLMEQKPFDARKFNLRGVSYLRTPDQGVTDGNPQAAIEAFKNAIRCDLRYGPAYLNLAQAYEQAGDLVAARVCLRRYLELMPNGDYAADARRRLATAGR
jgi:tetratricopeptide (TPR) repeat protein